MVAYKIVREREKKHGKRSIKLFLFLPGVSAEKKNPATVISNTVKKNIKVNSSGSDGILFHSL